MTKEELFPDVQDWDAFDVVYGSAYSAFDGEHTFTLPFRVEGAMVDLDEWFAIPSSAVTFMLDPVRAEDGGVLVTVLEDVAEITIGVQSSMLGGVATLHVTSATPAEWQLGRARYDNDVDYDFPELTPEDFAVQLLNPDWTPPEPEPNTSCISCHSSGGKYFQVEHTPTQVARFSDEDLTNLLTTGTKPPGSDFHVLPDELGDKTAEEVYAEYHRWEASAAQIRALIVYLRSLTPAGLGDDVP